MAGFNKVIVMGNLVKDPEKINLEGGNSVTNIRIALNKAWIDADNEKRTSTTYVDIKAFGKNADLVAKYFEKGKSILVEGHLSTNEWIDKETNKKRERMVVILDNFQFTSPLQQNGGKEFTPVSSNRTQENKPVVVNTRKSPVIANEEEFLF